MLTSHKPEFTGYRNAFEPLPIDIKQVSKYVYYILKQILIFKHTNVILYQECFNE